MSDQKTLTAQDLGFVLGCEVEMKVPTGETIVKVLDPMLLHGIWENIKLDLPFTNKPILRPYSSMTQEERRIKNNYDSVMGAIESIIDDKDYSRPGYKDEEACLKAIVLEEAKQIQYLMRQGIDVLDWIGHGLALDKTKLKS